MVREAPVTQDERPTVNIAAVWEETERCCERWEPWRSKDRETTLGGKCGQVGV